MKKFLSSVACAAASFGLCALFAYILLGFFCLLD